MRIPLVAGNWKMNGSQQSVEQLCQGILAGLDEVGNVDIVVCPPHVLVSSAAAVLTGSAVAIGGQDVDINTGGAFTGQTSAAMLKDAGCSCVIVGHSERRQFYGDTDDLVAEKTAVALAANLLPLVCVGETLQEREADVTQEVICRQLQTVIDKIGVAALAQCVVAYEPVWAIGTGVTASPDQAQEVHAFIRQLIAEQDVYVAQQCRILYGGSMKPDNAADLISKADIDGGLIGGAALVANDFLGICKAAS